MVATAKKGTNNKLIFIFILHLFISFNIALILFYFISSTVQIIGKVSTSQVSSAFSSISFCPIRLTSSCASSSVFASTIIL